MSENNGRFQIIRLSEDEFDELEKGKENCFQELKKLDLGGTKKNLRFWKKFLFAILGLLAAFLVYQLFTYWW